VHLRPLTTPRALVTTAGGLALLAVTVVIAQGRAPAEAPPRASRVPNVAAPQHPARHVRTPRPSHRLPLPVRLRIPEIGVDAPLIRLGLDEHRALEVPRRWDEAGWYAHGPRPGERGASVIAGHVDSTSGPAVFYRLGELHRRSRIEIRRRDGSTIHFRVRRVERWPKDRFPTALVYRRTRSATLRLITCGGAFDSASGHYLDNTIAFASR